MIICYLDVICVAFGKTEAYPPLVVNRNRKLSLPVSLQGMETVARRDPQIVDRRGKIDILQTPDGPLQNIGRKAQ